jgi:adenine-specific DNA-methyltransferase
MKPVATYQKLRGGYYTPKPIADFLARWAIQTPITTVPGAELWRWYVARGFH